MFYIKSKGTERARSENGEAVCLAVISLNCLPLPKVLDCGGGASSVSVCFVGGHPDRRRKDAAGNLRGIGVRK